MYVNFYVLVAFLCYIACISGQMMNDNLYVVLDFFFVFFCLYLSDFVYEG